MAGAGVTRAELSGHRFDLDTLATLFSAGDPIVYWDDSRCWLESVTLDGAGDHAQEIHRAATQLLTWINAAGRLHAGRAFRTVELRGHFQQTGPDGPIQHAVLVGRTGEFRIRPTIAAAGVVSGDGATPTQSTNGTSTVSGLVARASSTPDVAEVAELLSTPDLNWIVLYKIYEVVRDAVGSGEQGLVEAGLASRLDLSAFKASANHPAASGSAARHARQSGPPPRRTMTISEGDGFVRALVRTWLDSLDTARPEL